MINSEIQNLRERENSLRKSLYDPFAKPFKGSKAQRKNAEKELRKLQEKISELETSYERERRNRIQEEIASIERRLNEDFVGFWWEVYPLNYKDELRQELASLKKSL